MLLVLLTLTIIDNLILLFFGVQTEGYVVQYVNNYAGGSRYPAIKYPVIQYKVKQKEYRFNGNWDAEYSLGETVPVIYRAIRHKRARVNTFWGITKKPLIQFIIVFIIWSMIYSSFKPNQHKPEKVNRRSRT